MNFGIPNKYYLSAVSLIMLGGFLMVKGEKTVNLPTTEILGKEYYKYEVKKGESIYGIAKKYNWDLEELMRLNPEGGNTISKGDILYYPTGQVSVVTDMPEAVEIDFASLEPVSHTVKKGETIYSISRQYGVSLETLYRHNPEAKKGVKAGDVLEVPQTGINGYYHKVKKGDTYESLSQQYNTSKTDILANNPALKNKNLTPGETIKININSNLGHAKTELMAEGKESSSKKEKKDKIDSKVKTQIENVKEGNDFSSGENVEEEVLSEESNHSNDQKLVFRENDIDVPDKEDLEDVIAENNTMDQEESNNLSDSNLDSVDMSQDTEAVNQEDEDKDEVKIALLLDEPGSKKDIDFTRGFLVALDGMKNTSYRIDLKVLDGRVSTVDLTNELEGFEPNLIISTADKAFPLFLADYGNSNEVKILNVFDVKNDLYEDNTSMIQLLPPSAYFNDIISGEIYRENKDRKLIAIGDPDENDGIGSELFKLYDGNGEQLSLESFGTLDPESSESLLIYSYANKKEEIWDFFTNVGHLVETHPEVDYKIIGRSNWLAMSDEFNDKFSEYTVTIPSRVWVNDESENWKAFSSTYEELFGGTPMRSIPNFAASGYDVATYFIPYVEQEMENKSSYYTITNIHPLQNDFNLQNLIDGGGLVNKMGYLVKFKPGGRLEKHIVK